MSNKVNLGWLQDAAGERIAPKTFMSQVLSEDGKTLDKVLENLPNAPTEGGGGVGQKGEGENSAVFNNGSSHATAENTSAFGERTTASAKDAFATGRDTVASGICSHAEGSNTTASGPCSHAEGYQTTASGEVSHAEGYNTSAGGLYSHAEGCNTIANGLYSHAEGYNTSAIRNASHAEGYSTIANGLYSHAEGYSTIASGYASHAEGYRTVANGKGSHAEGYSTSTTGMYCHVQGSYNDFTVENAYDVSWLHMVGNGKSESERSNAHTLDAKGNAEFAGDVIAYGCGKENSISLVETANDLNNKISSPLTAEIGQLLSVKAIDENGKPVEWETISIEDIANQVKAML